MLKRISKKIGVVVLFLSCLLIFTSSWILDTFGIVTVEEIVFTLMVPQKGMNMSVVYSFIFEVLIISILMTIVFYYLILKDYKIKLEIDLNIKKFNFKKIVYPFNKIVRVLLLILMFSGSLYYTLVRLEIPEYIESQIVTSMLIEDEYVDTRSVNLDFGDKKRNLIYIFLESMEVSYSSYKNGGIQRVDLIDDLVKLANENISFSNTDKLGGAQSMPGTTWTVGAMVAQTSGLPLKLSISENYYGKYNTFLPGAYTLGEVLEDNGYNQMIMFGSDASFGGRDSYFKDHGNYQIFDVNTAIDRGKMRKEDKVWWGFEDKNLFDWAKDEIIKLSKEEEPFNFTMLTVDTHFEDGYLSDSCKADYGDQYSNVISCASDMIYEFVRWIQEQDFYENTTIVLAGDHLTMDSNYFADMKDGYVRTIYNVFINSVVDTTNIKNRQFTTMDLFPTTLAAMGVNIDGDRLGIGTNLFSNQKTVAEKYGVIKLREELAKTSEFYNNKFVYIK